MKTILLRHTGTGEIFRWTYKSLTHDQARARAAAILKRRGGDPLAWKEISIEQEAAALGAAINPAANAATPRTAG